MVEIWKDIAGYEGLYQVSNFGKVKALSRMEAHQAYMREKNYYRKFKTLSLWDFQ